MRKNTASQIVSFQAISTTDGSDVTAGSPTVYYTIDGGTQGTGAGTTAHEGNGQWSYAPTQAETNGNHVAFTFVLSGAVSQTVNVYPVSFDPTDAADLGVTALTGHTPQTGDSFARIGANGGSLTQLGGMSATMKAQVNTEVVDTLATDTYAEPSSVPSATSSLKDKIGWLFTLSRNKLLQTSTTSTVRNDADGANIATAGVSDDGTTFTRNEYS